MKSYDDHTKNCETIWDGDKHWESYLVSGLGKYLIEVGLDIFHAPE